MFLQLLLLWTKRACVILLVLISFSKDALADNKIIYDNNKILYKGNIFELYMPPDDTVYRKNPVSGAFERLLTGTNHYPCRMNGEILLNADEVSQKPLLKGYSREQLHATMLKKYKELLENLDDGEYQIGISQIVVGKNGDVIFYKWDGIERVENAQKPNNERWSAKNLRIPKTEVAFDNSFEQFIETIKFYPAQKEGKAVDCYFEKGIGAPLIIVIKNHQVGIKR